jgi:CheY-like chemotaxis protein
MLIQVILERAGARVTVVENGALAIAAIAPDTDHFDAVVTDIQMPIIDGYELANQLRQLGWAKPIIALTALAAPEDKARCLAAGCSDYLTKPIDPADFPTALANAIRSHSQEAVMP